MIAPADLFLQHKYVVRRACIGEPRLSLLYRYACKRAESGAMMHDAQVPAAWAAHGDVFTDGLLIDFLPIAEEVSNLELFPTYSYLRVYGRGHLLEKHTDRQACEISFTLCLGYRAERPWPILIAGPSGISSIELAPGDGLFYRGIECPHWREPLEGEQAAQVFLHYVDKNGPYSEWKYDKRPALPFQKPNSFD
jgi:hypothetical protein